MDEVLLPEILPEQAVVIANGLFPDHPIPLEILQKSNFNIYCDGAAKRSHLDKYAPDIIIGDLDSIQKDVYDKYREIIVRVETQDTSDLEKALLWCNKYSIKSVVILGASGLREDHLISNIFLLESYCQDFDHISMITNYGSFSPVYSEKIFERFYSDRQENIKNHTGLGLSIAREIIEHMHGSISLDKSDKSDYPGACFLITLPIKH